MNGCDVPPPKCEQVSTTTHHSSSAMLRLGQSGAAAGASGPGPSGSASSSGRTDWSAANPQGGVVHDGSSDVTLAQSVLACHDHWLSEPAVASTSRSTAGSHHGAVVSSHGVPGSSAVAAASSQSRPSLLVASTRGVPAGLAGVGATAATSCSRVTTTTRIQPALSALSRVIAAVTALRTPVMSQSAPFASSSATT